MDVLNKVVEDTYVQHFVYLFAKCQNKVEEFPIYELVHEIS